MLRPSLPAGWRGNRLPRPKAGCASQALGSKLNRMNLFRPFRADKETPKKLETHTPKSTEELGRSNSLRSGCCGELKPSCFAALAAAAGWPRRAFEPARAEKGRSSEVCEFRVASGPHGAGELHSRLQTCMLQAVVSPVWPVLRGRRGGLLGLSSLPASPSAC